MSIKKKENLALWEEVSSTPSAFVKPIIIKGRKVQDAVDTTYQKKLLTQMFGLAGIGWGLEELRFETCETTDKSGTIHLVRVLHTTFYYHVDKKKGNIPVSVCMPFDQRGEVHKKLRTMALSKAISDLGVSADVFLGKFDDKQYVQDKKAEEYWGNLAKLSKPALTKAFRALTKENQERPDIKEGFAKLFEAFKK